MKSSFGLARTELRQHFNRSWRSAAAHLVLTRNIPLDPVNYAHIMPSGKPTDLASKFVTAYTSGKEDENISSQKFSESLLLFSSCSLIADHTTREISDVVSCLTTLQGAEHIRREAVNLLFLAAVLRLKSEADLPSLIEIGTQALGCDSALVKPALLLSLKFTAPWKPLSLLDIDECKQYESKVRWCAINHSRTSAFF